MMEICEFNSHCPCWPAHFPNDAAHRRLVADAAFWGHVDRLVLPPEGSSIPITFPADLVFGYIHRCINAMDLGKLLDLFDEDEKGRCGRSFSSLRPPESQEASRETMVSGFVG